MKKIKCKSCNKKVNIVCKDGFCRNCHKTCSFNDCVTSTFEAKNLLKFRSKDEILKIYPNAQI